jgi:hypothetical protein
MPLTDFQAELASLLAKNRSPESYLAGGAAIHIDPNSLRYSNDLDYFNDTVERVTEAFEKDRLELIGKGYTVAVDMKQIGYIRALVSKGDQATKIEWAHDSAWRFMPTILHPEFGYQLHPIDLAINKVLALVGRDEPRDFLDVMYIHQEVLSLGALCWAAAGKDPGFTPLSLLELLRRRGRLRPEDVSRLHLVEPVDLQQLKTKWLAALDAANTFIKSRPPQEIGCLYYSRIENRFIEPGDLDVGNDDNVILHSGKPGGGLPDTG